MKLFKFITFRLIRFIYLFPSIIFYQIKKNKNKYSFNRNRKYLIEKNLSLNNVFSEIENFYLIEKKNQIEKIINDNINKNKYYTEIDYLLDDKLKNKLLEYLNNKDFVNYLSSFFGHQLKFNSFLIRLNFFNSNLPENEGPKMWHRDNDSFFGQIKLFSVLNDLNSNTGGLFSFIPQIYIKDYEFVRPDGVVSVPDNNIKNYYIHDLEYILKDVEISDRDKFYDIVNNSYLYNDSELNDYFANIDDYILQKMKFFMDVLKQNCSNKQEMIKTVNVLKKDVNELKRNLVQ